MGPIVSFLFRLGRLTQLLLHVVNQIPITIVIAAVAIAMVLWQNGSDSVMIQLLILLGVIVTSLQQRAAAARLAENTVMTKNTEAKTETLATQINGRLDALLDATRKAGYAEGYLKGQQDQRKQDEPK